MVLRSIAIFAISMLLGGQAFNLMRGAGDSFFSFMMALAVVLGLFVSESLLAAAVTQRENQGKEAALIYACLAACFYGEYLVYQAGTVSMAIGGYKQIDKELEGSYEMRLLEHQKNNALWNSHNCGKTGDCSNHEALDKRSDDIAGRMSELRESKTDTPTQAAMAATGNDVASVASTFAALIQLVSIILAFAIGIVWGTEIPDAKKKVSSALGKKPTGSETPDTTRSRVRAKLAANKAARAAKPAPSPAVKPVTIPAKTAPVPLPAGEGTKESREPLKTAAEYANDLMRDLPKGNVYSKNKPVTTELTASDVAKHFGLTSKSTVQKIMDILANKSVIQKRPNRSALIAKKYQREQAPKVEGMISSGETYVRPTEDDRAVIAALENLGFKDKAKSMAKASPTGTVDERVKAAQRKHGFRTATA